MDNKMNVDEMARVVDTSIMYKNEMELNMKSILTSLDNLLSYYKTDNSSKLSDINFSLEKNFEALNQIYNYNINTLSKNITTYKETDINVKNVFQNL